MPHNSRSLFLSALGAVALLLAGPLPAHDLEEVLVEGRRGILVGEARSASEGVIGQMDLALRPLLRPGDVLESIPGMIVTQHSGAGKSNQMFLRGFNLDHGTDFATWIDGMPVNMRSHGHGHGQGYTDINFLIPEAIESLSFVKGPYHAELGDFSSAGGAQIRTFQRMPHQRIKLGLGDDGYARLLALGGVDLSRTHLAGAIEAQTYGGPWTDIREDVEKINGLLKLSGAYGPGQWSLSAMHYDNTWNSADQIPARAVARGTIDELGSLDTSLGGSSRRTSLSAAYRNGDELRSSAWNAYLIDYRMRLWSNFTYRLERPVSGDQFEQFDDRRIWGGNWNHSWSRGEAGQWQHRLGAELRYDDIGKVALYPTRRRQRLGVTREDSVEEASAGAFYELEWRIAPNWRTVLGLRGDYFDFSVDAGDPRNAGDSSDYQFSPKASLIYTLSATAEAYLSAGRGFHSNDARGTTISVDPGNGAPVDTVDPLVQSSGAELGFKSLWRERWNTSAALWYLELDSELLFVGDAGTTEASRPSRRWGVEINSFWMIDPVWSLEVDLSWTHARFRDSAAEGRHIPGAIPLVATGALSARYPGGWFGSLRLRHFARYPLLEDNSEKAGSSTFASLALGWSGDRWGLRLDALNLFDSSDHDIDYFYASRLAGEPAAGVEDEHYKVLEPRQLRAYLSFTF